MYDFFFFFSVFFFFFLFSPIFLISGAGAYNATGLSGVFNATNGVMTALNHGSSGDFDIHLVVEFF